LFIWHCHISSGLDIYSSIVDARRLTVYHLARYPESSPRPGFDENGIGPGRAPIPRLYGTGEGAARDGQRPVSADGLIHFLHFLAAALRRGRLRGGVLKGIALMTEVTLLLGLSGRRFCILLLAITVTTHKQSPFPLVEGIFSLEIRHSGF